VNNAHHRSLRDAGLSVDLASVMTLYRIFLTENQVADSIDIASRVRIAGSPASWSPVGRSGVFQFSQQFVQRS